jgi:hypothetical protein
MNFSLAGRPSTHRIASPGIITKMLKTVFAALTLAAILQAQADPGARSVARFGARPDDGATDATPGIQAAIATFKAGRVYLPGDVAGTGAAARAEVRSGAVTNIELTSGGDNYCKAPLIALTGNGTGAKATARVDRDCHLTGISLDAAGAGYTETPYVQIIPQLRCYKVSQLHIFTGTMLEGDGQATCLIPDGTNKPVLFSEGAYEFRLRNFEVRGDGRTDIGMQFNGSANSSQSDGSPASDGLLCTLDGITIRGFRTKNIELNRTYGFLFLNVHSYDSGGWGLYLRDGFNNATQIVGGEFSANGVGGLYVGNDSIQLYFSSIAEGNKKYAIYYHGHITGLHINDAYFEGNGTNRTGWDVYGDLLDYDQPAIGVSIRNTLFNSLDAAYAVHIENTVDFEFSHNIGMPAFPGEPFTQNAVVLGKGVVNPVFNGNTRFDIRGESGHPIQPEPPAFSENLLLQSSTLNRRSWKYENAGKRCAGGASVCQDGTRFHQNGLAWKVSLPIGSGAANMTTLSQTVPGTKGGHLIGGGAWMRTNAGSGTAWLEVADNSAVYTGTTLNQPLRQTIDSDWRWIHTTVATGAEGSETTLRFRFYANDGEAGSDTEAIYIQAPQAWLDVTGTPQYVATGTAPVSRRLQTPALPGLSGQPECKGVPNGIIGYDAATDRIWTCANGVAKPH